MTYYNVAQIWGRKNEHAQIWASFTCYWVIRCDKLCSLSHQKQEKAIAFLWFAFGCHLACGLLQICRYFDALPSFFSDSVLPLKLSQRLRHHGALSGRVLRHQSFSQYLFTPLRSTCTREAHRRGFPVFSSCLCSVKSDCLQSHLARHGEGGKTWQKMSHIKCNVK